MFNTSFDRRRLLQLTGGLIGSSLLPASALAAEAIVPDSGATAPPTWKGPANTTDCHHHIFDARFNSPNQKGTPPDATVQQYLQLKKLLGIGRHVVIQPSAYGTDNACMLDALKQFGDTARGIAVVDMSVTDATLQEMDKAGVRGVRYNFLPAGENVVVEFDQIKPMAERVAKMGWHVQINMSAEELTRHAALWHELPCPVVFDHLAHVPEPEGVKAPVFMLISSLLQQKKAWVKLSAFYIDTKIGPPTYADSVAVARGYAEVAPDRVLWGSDWPHPGQNPLPDDSLLFDLIPQWAQSIEVQQKALVDNPAALYGFKG